MTTRQNLNSAVDSREAGGHDTKICGKLFQEYNGTTLPGHRAMCELSPKRESSLLLRLVNVISY